MKRITVTILAATLCVLSTGVDAETAGEVSGWCQAFGDIQAGSGGQFPMPNTADAMRCWGAFTAVQDLIMLTMSRKPVLQVCAPPESTRIELIHVYLHYVKQNPQEEHVGFGPVAMAALWEAYPCR